MLNHFAFVYYVESKIIYEAEKNSNWIMAMQEKLNQFEKNQVWNLGERSKNYPIIEQISF